MTKPATGIQNGLARATQLPAQAPAAGEFFFSVHGTLVTPHFCEHEAINPGQAGEFESQSSQRTREALLTLDDCPADECALNALWEENHLAFESQMKGHFDWPENPTILKQVFTRVVSLSNLYCDEIDDPKAWVARCANLETRRVALQLTR